MTEGTNNMYMPVVPQGFGGANGGFGFDGNNGWWILILLILFGWNGNGNWGNNGGVGNEVQRGFDQNAIMNGLSGLRGDIANAQYANANQNFTLQSALQNCCCENRLATSDLKYTVANESALTRQANAANTQAVMDKLCQLELDGIKQNYEGQLRAMQNQLAAAQAENQSLKFAASQGAQTAKIMADNAAQTVALEQYLAPVPRPCYTVPNPNIAYQQNCGCGCNV